MKLKRPRVSRLSIVSLLLLISVLVLWVRSRGHGDIVGFYTPAGHLQALASDRVGILVFLSDVPFGREYGLSADAMSVSADEFNQIHDWLYDKTREKWHFGGFRLAQGKLDLTASLAPKYSALIVPYWLLATVLAAAPLGTFRRLLIRHGRRRRGECLNCGYDLRQSTERCPECGTIIAKDSATTQTGKTRRATRSGAKMILWCLVATGVAAGAVLALRQLRHSRRDSVEAARAAVLDRRIAELNLRGATLKQAIDRLAQLTGARIAISETLPPPAGGGSGASIVFAPPEATTDLDLHAVRLGTALEVLFRVFAVPYPSMTYDLESDGTIDVADDRSLDPVVRVYDVRQLLAEFAAGRPPSHLDEEVMVYSILPLDHQTFWCNEGRLAVIEARPTQRCIELRLLQLGRVLSGRPPPATADGLDRRIGETRVENLALAEVIQTVANRAKSNLVLDVMGFQNAPISTGSRLTYHLRNPTIRSALGASLLAAGYHHPLNYPIYDNVIFVSPYYGSPDHWVARGYDVHDLLQHFTEYVHAHPSPWPVMGNGPVTPPTDRRRAEQELSQTITDAVEPEMWKDNGGDGEVVVSSGRVISIGTPQVDAEVEGLFETLRYFERAPAEGRGVRWLVLPDVNWTLAKLEQRVTEFRLDSVPLTQALEKLADIGGIDIVLDVPALEEVEQSSTAPVTVHLHDVPFHFALATLLRQGSGSVALGYSVHDGFICVSTAEYADHEVVTRLYDARDFADSSGPSSSGADALIRTIEDRIDAQSWKDNGGPGSIRELAGLLIVRATVENHRQVESLIQKLRQAYRKSRVSSTRKTVDN